MGSKIHQQTDLLIYEEITSGRLNPMLPRNADLSVLQNLIIEANTKTFFTCSLEDDPENIIDSFDLTELGYHFREDVEVVIRKNEKKKMHELIARPKRIYPLEDQFIIPDPPDKKSAYFLVLISDEFERVKIRANKVLNSTGKKKHIALFAYKNLQRAKKIQYDLRYMLAKIHKPWSSVTDNPNAYVIFVLDVFLGRIITFYQQLFQPFILAFPKYDQPISTIPVTPLYITHPYLYQDIPSKSNAYKLQVDGSIFDHQFNYQVDKLKDISESNSGYGIKSDTSHGDKKSLQQKQPSGVGTRLKWHGQLNVLVDIMLQLSSDIKVNGRPPLEATLDELRLFIRENFLDKDGREISPFTLDTYLKPNRQDKRLHHDSPKRIDLSGFFNIQESGNE
jgi:hypothetical protein